MSHKLHYTDNGRRLHLEIFGDAESQEIENIVSAIHRWHWWTLKGELRGLQTTSEFDAWCWQQGYLIPAIARLVNDELGDLMREHVRRKGHLDALVDGSGKGKISFEVFMLQVKTAIDSLWPAQTAARIIGLALPRKDTQEIEEWLFDAAARIFEGQDPFEELHPIDPKTIARAIARHRARGNC